MLVNVGALVMSHNVIVIAVPVGTQTLTISCTYLLDNVKFQYVYDMACVGQGMQYDPIHMMSGITVRNIGGGQSKHDA